MRQKYIPRVECNIFQSKRSDIIKSTKEDLLYVSFLGGRAYLKSVPSAEKTKSEKWR